MAPSEKSFSAPVVYGFPLLAAAYAVEYIPLVAYKLAKDGGLLALRDKKSITDRVITLAIPQSYILAAAKENEKSLTPSDEGQWPNLEVQQRSSSLHLSFWDYHLAYLEKRTTPLAVAQKVVKLLDQHDKYNWMRSFDKKAILDQAEESTQRYELGKPKSQLDGIFIPVKEEMDVAGLETKGGTGFVNDGNPAKKNCHLVQRLQDAGAIIVGHTVMDELGWDTFSVNPSTGMPCNPYETNSSCGGSSGGCGGVVAANLFPISIGCDGGGSVRIPSAFCGLYGLKTTTGRVSSAATGSVDSTVAVNGPLAATADDMALAYAIMSGADPKDPQTTLQPPVSLKDYALTQTLEGITIGIMPGWNDRTLEPAMLRQLDVFAKHFESLGATLVEIDIPDLDLAKTAHLITICAESYNFVSQYPSQRTSFSPYTRLMSAVTRCLNGSDYSRSQQIRSRIMDQLKHIFEDEKVDLILTPATGMQTPVIPKKAHRYGLSNATWTTTTMEFTTLANFSGIPAVSIPSGFHNGKPLGIQLMAKWYNEALLCRMAKVCELTPGIERKRPAVWTDPLS